MGYLYIVGIFVFSAYAQIAGKWRINALGWHLAEGSVWAKAWSYLCLLFDPVMLTCVASATAASFCWNMAVSKMNLTAVLPFSASIPIGIFFLGIFVLGESFTPGKLVGLLLVVAGIIIAIKF